MPRFASAAVAQRPNIHGRSWSGHEALERALRWTDGAIIRIILDRARARGEMRVTDRDRRAAATAAAAGRVLECGAVRCGLTLWTPSPLPLLILFSAFWI